MLIAEMRNIVDYQLINMEHALAYFDRAVVEPQMLEADALIGNYLTNLQIVNRLIRLCAVRNDGQKAISIQTLLNLVQVNIAALGNNLGACDKLANLKLHTFGLQLQSYQIAVDFCQGKIAVGNVDKRVVGSINLMQVNISGTLDLQFEVAAVDSTLVAKSGEFVVVVSYITVLQYVDVNVAMLGSYIAAKSDVYRRSPSNLR